MSATNNECVNVKGVNINKKSIVDICNDTPLVKLSNMLRGSGKKSIKELLVKRTIVLF